MKERLRFGFDRLNFVYITSDSVDCFLSRTNGQPIGQDIIRLSMYILDPYGKNIFEEKHKSGFSLPKGAYYVDFESRI